MSLVGRNRAPRVLKTGFINKVTLTIVQRTIILQLTPLQPQRQLINQIFLTLSFTANATATAYFNDKSSKNIFKVRSSAHV
jgi:hypothetical protein